MSAGVRRSLGSPAVRWGAAAVVVLVAAAGLAPAFEGAAVGATVRRAVADPPGVMGALAAYAGAFALRAALWPRVLRGLAPGHALAALHVALAGNHLLPLRLGEALRVTSVVRRAGVALAPAVASTVALRAADVVGLALVAVVLGPGVAVAALGWGVGVVLAVGGGALAAGAWWLARQRRAGAAVRLPGVLVLLGATAAWLLEAGVMLAATRWAGIALSPAEAAVVTAVTVGAQLLAVAPGGLGTYEAAGTAALVALGADAPQALAAALAAHALKTLYALVTGAVAAFVPAPGLAGRLRLAPVPCRGRAPVPDGGVALVLPAHNEAATVADVVARAPRTVGGRGVTVIVVDDGSRDATAQLAAAAGAAVVSLERNHGLGAAVRAGLATAVDAGYAAVAFCDADGEYAPEELAAVLAPILDGAADYVVGSRFAGDIQRMRPHRRLGNRVLTAALRAVARAPITDGQSGYRALSRAAAADAAITHDYNYAQVLTLDLLGKGYRYAEVPITYAFRDHGTSFVRLVPYLRRVVPAVWRQLNPDPALFAGLLTHPWAVTPVEWRRRGREGAGACDVPPPTLSLGRGGCDGARGPGPALGSATTPARSRAQGWRVGPRNGPGGRAAACGGSDPRWVGLGLAGAARERWAQAAEAEHRQRDQRVG